MTLLSRSISHRAGPLTALALITLFMATSARAGISYSLDRAHAAAGETITVQAVLFNDTDSALDWTAPKTLVLQWRNERGRAIRSLAQIETGQRQVNLPVNNFVKFLWHAVVPSHVQGLQSVSVEGDPTLLALDTNPLEKSPVVAAGTASGDHQPDRPASQSEVRAAGASMAQGPAPDAAGTTGTTPTAFDKFRNAISPYEPIYIDFGNKNGTDARLQLSFKYRLFTPTDAKNTSFLNHLYLGYTQTALWDLAGKSKPFVDTTYNPSIFWQKDLLWESEQHNWFVGLASGIEHKSNGKSGMDSRSLNNVFIQPEFNYRFGGGSTLSFTPRLKGYFGTNENPDYISYAGRVDWKLRWAQDNGLILTGLYRQGHHGRHTEQLEAAWPLRRTFLNMNGYLHLQYFNGYGETLLGYNHKSEPQIRIGLSLVP